MPHPALIIRDYDEAVAFYVGKLSFDLVEDVGQPTMGGRSITLRPPGAGAGLGKTRFASTTVVLTDSRRAGRHVGDQSDRVSLFLVTDDFARDYAAFTAAGVTWVRPPATHGSGTVAVFADLYGNLWELVEFA